MRTINICYKVPEAHAYKVEKVLKAHAEHIRVSYISDNSRGDNPIDAYFTKAVELNNPANPADGTTGHIIFTLNEKWIEPEHIQSHIGRTMEAPHFPDSYLQCKIMQPSQSWVKFFKI